MMDYQEAIEVINNHERYVGIKYVNGVEEAYVNPYFEKAHDTAISAMQELQLYKDNKLCLIPENAYRKQCDELDGYKQLGTLEEMKLLKATHLTGDELAQISCMLKQLAEYEKIGTLEEVRDAVEKQKAKNPKNVGTEGYRYTDTYRCPTCGDNFSGTGIANYCYHCGQKLNWSEEE